MTEPQEQSLTSKMLLELGYKNAALRYHIVLKDIAHASNAAELHAAILKHKDVLGECM